MCVRLRRILFLMFEMRSNKIHSFERTGFVIEILFIAFVPCYEVYTSRLLTHFNC
jgi:hypothetical protein